jgi:hypothetical protein
MIKTYRTDRLGRGLFARVYPNYLGLNVVNFAESIRAQLWPVAQSLGMSVEDFVLRGTNRNGAYMETFVGDNNAATIEKLIKAGFNSSKAL